MLNEPLDFVFWGAPIRHRPYEEHVRAAAAGGFTSLAIAAPTYAEARTRGLRPADLTALAADHGVALRHFDTLSSWAPTQQLPTDEDLRARALITLDQGLAICAELGLTQLLATPAYQRAGPVAQLVDGFGQLCERAGQLGIWVNLEPMPFTGCPDVAAAWAIVGGAAPPNGGIMLDSWHFYRAAGQTLAVLADIPGRYLRAVQLSDVPLALAPTLTMMAENLTARRWPGQGELPLRDFLRAIYAKGYLTTIGPEVFNSEVEQLPTEVVGRVAGETTRAALRAAGVPIPADAPDTAAAVGRAALAAWEMGESARGYDQFLALVAPDFRVFSHPSLERGYHTGPAARHHLDALIATRLAHPDRLTFSQVLVVPGPVQADGTRWVVTTFDAAGALPDNPHFRGYNAIAFLLDHANRLIGFREYFGDVA